MHTVRLAALAAASCAVLTAQSPGLRLFQPLGPSEQTSLVDSSGAIVHSWTGGANQTAHLLPDGSLIRGERIPAVPTIGGVTGLLRRVSFDGTLLWDYPIAGPTEVMHHDVEPMPNGNVLVIVWDILTAADAIAAGRDPALLVGNDWFPDAVLEIQQTGPTTGNVVWEWHLIDHVIQDHDPSKSNHGVVANHPELLDINFPPVVVDNGDWNHFNGIDYDPVNDLIIVSSREQSEIYIIDHSTTTAEAAGHTGGNHGKGGDILWRWGNPEGYGAGTSNERQLFFQHDPRFIPPGYPGAGNVTVFNNDYIFPVQSAVFELVLPLDPAGNFVIDPGTGRYGPTAPTWLYTDPLFFSSFISSAERLANGNTLVCSGQQFELFEVDQSGTVVWNYVYTPNGQSFGVFQAHHVDRTLWADSDALPIGGAQVDFHHLVDSSYVNDTYFLLGSISGTSPGIMFPGGVTLPLNYDFLTAAMATQFNNGLFVDTRRRLDANGAGTSAIVVGPGFIPASLVGTDLDFAYIVFDTTLLVSHGSNPVRVTIVP